MKITLEVEVGNNNVLDFSEAALAMEIAASAIRARGSEARRNLQNMFGMFVGRLSVTNDPIGRFDAIVNEGGANRRSLSSW